MQEEIFKDNESSNTIKESICIGTAKGYAHQGKPDKELSFYLKAMAFRMGALNYEGEHKGNFMQFIKAHG